MFSWGLKGKIGEKRVKVRIEKCLISIINFRWTSTRISTQFFLASGWRSQVYRRHNYQTAIWRGVFTWLLFTLSLGILFKSMLVVYVRLIIFATLTSIIIAQSSDVLHEVCLEAYWTRFWILVRFGKQLEKPYSNKKPYYFSRFVCD